MGVTVGDKKRKLCNIGLYCPYFKYTMADNIIMTRQIAEAVTYNGETYYTYTKPFHQYLFTFKPKERPRFYGEHNANWTGYGSDYAIRDNQLFWAANFFTDGFFLMMDFILVTTHYKQDRIQSTTTVLQFQ